MYMIDSDLDSNQHPFLKSPSTNIIISNHGPILRVFSSQCPFRILKSMADLLVRVFVSDIIGRQFLESEKLQ